MVVAREGGGTLWGRRGALAPGPESYILIDFALVDDDVHSPNIAHLLLLLSCLSDLMKSSIPHFCHPEPLVLSRLPQHPILISLIFQIRSVVQKNAIDDSKIVRPDLSNEMTTSFSQVTSGLSTLEMTSGISASHPEMIGAPKKIVWD